MMMQDHAADLVFEYFVTKHDDQVDSLEEKLKAMGSALVDFFGGGAFGFNLTISDAAKPAKGASSD